MALLVALAACGVDPTVPPPSGTLSTDTYFTLPLGTTACDAPVPEGCQDELGVCADGTYAYKLGDVITAGTYSLADDALRDPDSSFVFQLPSDISDDDNGNVLGPWEITSSEEDPDVACGH